MQRRALAHIRAPLTRIRAQRASSMLASGPLSPASGRKEHLPCSHQDPSRPHQKILCPQGAKIAITSRPQLGISLSLHTSLSFHYFTPSKFVCLCVCVCVHARVRTSVRASVRVCMFMCALRNAHLLIVNKLLSHSPPPHTHSLNHALTRKDSTQDDADPPHSHPYLITSSSNEEMCGFRGPEGNNLPSATCAMCVITKY
jgi:hypothetical protein